MRRISSRTWSRSLWTGSTTLTSGLTSGLATRDETVAEASSGAADGPIEGAVLRRWLFALLMVLVEAMALAQPASGLAPSRASVLVDEAVAQAGSRAEGPTLRVVVVEQDASGHLVVARHDVGSQSAAERVVATADQRAKVLSVEVDGRSSVAATTVASDPLRSQQWALDATTYEKAWPVSSGSGVVVAVVDTG